MARKEVEARRGIERDENGHIVRSKEWLEARLEWLDAKEADLNQRIKNIKVEREQRTNELNEL
jgi:hypothetical protein